MALWPAKGGAIADGELIDPAIPESVSADVVPHAPSAPGNSLRCNYFRNQSVEDESCTGVSRTRRTIGY